MPAKRPSPAQNAKKPTKASAKPTPKKTPAPVAAAPKKWSAAKVAPPPAAPAPVVERELSQREQRFAEEYLVDLNATQAYMRVHGGVKAVTASTEGCKLLGNPKVAGLIAKGRAELSERTGISAAKALEQAWAVATADARELIDYIVGCCRNCYGEGFKHQRTLAEYNIEREKWQIAFDAGDTSMEWDEKGGIGFDPRKDPNIECPACFGKGHGQAHINDTRKLSAAGAALYAGVKITKDGFEVKMHSKLDALEKVFKHLGLYEKDNNQRVDPIATLLANMARSSIPVVKDAGHE